jgi:hypothetical protein
VPSRIALCLALACAACACDSPDPAPRRPGVEGARFTDTTAASGIDHAQATTEGGCGFAPCYTGGAAVGDFDGDGAPDLFVTRFDAPGILYQNRGDGTFEDVTEAAGLATPLYGSGAAWGDLDGDGDLDLVMSTVMETRFFAFFQDAGTFSEQAAMRGLAVDDGLAHAAFSVAIGDYDLDGWLDVLTTEWEATTPGELGHARLLRNRGEAGPGTFEDVTVAAGVTIDLPDGRGGWTFSAAITDLDDDGAPDLAITGDHHQSRLYWGDGEGAFVEGTQAAHVGTDDSGMGMSIADFDGDGRLDWFVTAIMKSANDPLGSGNRLYRNLGGRAFEDVTDTADVRDGGWGWGTVAIDYDQDGALDIAETNGSGPPVGLGDFPLRLWHNDGSGRFREVAAEVGLDDRENGRAFVSLDYDLDGDEDLFLVRESNTPILFRNEGGERGAWLRVRPLAKRGGTAALGARVIATVAPGAPPLVREVVAGGAFLGQNEPVAHFGLGDADRVAELSVRFPGGAEVVLHDVPARQVVEVREPE